MNDITDKRKLVKSFFTSSKPLISELSASLGYTRKTIRRNFKQLKQEKIINNFTININPYLIPNLSYVFLEIKTNPQEPELISNLVKIPHLIMLDGIFGEFSLIAQFIFRNSEEFNQTLQKVDN
ncbi:MAG: hypothetical protein GF383_07845, partial [Candidatus Lokiarchaeota archaeon]|nr:hypothetical protein [Candidatus Lokiarchaeota archaeon]MBD3340184.1 hypothetical protein [Candidatus Lokiarchaeota archaeon]